MSATPGPNWYDVLDVDATATTDEIRDAWRAAIADLTPTDRRFRLYNQAAEVLLDPERRAVHDAELAEAEAEVDSEPEPQPEPEPDPAATVAEEPPADDATSAPGEPPSDVVREKRALPVVPTWLLAGVAVLTVLAAGITGYLWSQPSEESVAEATTSARNAAERSIEPLLSYDYRDLDGSREAAEDVITADYGSEYDKFFEGVVQGNAERTKTVVTAQHVASAVVRGDEDRVELLLFVDQATTNVQTEKPVVYRNQARVFMERVGDEWLVDCVLTKPDGTCGS